MLMQDDMVIVYESRELKKHKGSYPMHELELVGRPSFFFFELGIDMR